MKAFQERDMLIQCRGVYNLHTRLHVNEDVGMRCTVLSHTSTYCVCCLFRQSVLLDGVPVMAVEMLAAWGWERYSHVQHGMTTFGMTVFDHMSLFFCCLERLVFTSLSSVLFMTFNR